MTGIKSKRFADRFREKIRHELDIRGLLRRKVEISEMPLTFSEALEFERRLGQQWHMASKQELHKISEKEAPRLHSIMIYQPILTHSTDHDAPLDYGTIEGKHPLVIKAFDVVYVQQRLRWAFASYRYEPNERAYAVFVSN
jgi:hypothetical protein